MLNQLQNERGITIAEWKDDPEKDPLENLKDVLNKRNERLASAGEESLEYKVLPAIATIRVRPLHWD